MRAAADSEEEKPAWRSPVVSSKPSIVSRAPFRTEPELDTALLSVPALRNLWQ